MSRPNWAFMRYATVGLAANGAAYFAYIALCLAGIGNKSAMTLCFVGSVLLSFALNRNWSFKSTSPVRRALPRYAAVYVGGYLLNLLGLIAFVDWLGFRHEIVQAFMIAFIAVLLFAAQRSWVFPERPAASPTRSSFSPP